MVSVFWVGEFFGLFVGRGVGCLWVLRSPRLRAGLKTWLLQRFGGAWLVCVPRAYARG